MSEFRNQIKNLEKAGRYKDKIIVGLFLVVAAIVLAWQDTVKGITLHYPPDLRSGAELKIGDVPPHNVYNFAEYIMQQLYTWHENGEVDYFSNLNRLRFLSTPEFQRFITDDINERKVKGELKNRTRTISPVSGADYDESKVIVHNTNGTWTVWLDFHIVEHFKDHKVKDIKLRYPVKVIAYDIDREFNPWQLGIDGFAGPGPIQLN